MSAITNNLCKYTNQLLHFISYISAECTNCLVRQVVLCCGTHVVTSSHSIPDRHLQNYGLYNTLMELMHEPTNQFSLPLQITELIALHSDGVWNKHCNTALKNKFCRDFLSQHSSSHATKNFGIMKKMRRIPVYKMTRCCVSILQRSMERVARIARIYRYIKIYN